MASEEEITAIDGFFFFFSDKSTTIKYLKKIFQILQKVSQILFTKMYKAFKELTSKTANAALDVI